MVHALMRANEVMYCIIVSYSKMSFALLCCICAISTTRDLQCDVLHYDVLKYDVYSYCRDSQVPYCTNRTLIYAAGLSGGLSRLLIASKTG